MAIRINNIKLSIDDEMSLVKKRAASVLNIREEDIKYYRILKQSIDARKKDSIFFIYHVEVECDNEKSVLSHVNDKNVFYECDTAAQSLVYGDAKMNGRPVVIGSGPAGLFAALELAQNGYNPIMLERGADVDSRTKTIKNFWQTGNLNVDTNVQFGEGGAGTFSDGKLTTRIKDPNIDYVLEKFIESGAPEEIRYSGKPHIGTDILKDVVRGIRNKIIELGGEVRFNSRVTDIGIRNDKICSVTINGSEQIACDAVILAIGHSARDTYQMLLGKGMEFVQKPFAIGARVEHLQSMINESQYGKFAGHPKLTAADYRLAFNNASTGRSCYSFCMCPGGIVVAAASEENMLVTNGMSEYKRDKANANSAIVVSVGPSDFKSSHPLAGVEFQRNYERAAYVEGGGGYIAPVQLVGDFLKDRQSKKIGSIDPGYTRGWRFGKLSNCLPSYVIDTMKEAFVSFDRKIHGFSAYDAVLTGIETRTSAPIRMVRGEDYQSSKIAHLYPCGEGAGYAGGIMSAAVDGIRVARSVMGHFAPNDGI